MSHDLYIKVVSLEREVLKLRGTVNGQNAYIEELIQANERLVNKIVELGGEAPPWVSSSPSP